MDLRSKSQQFAITLITVVRNNAEGLLKTINSIATYKCTNTQYIVIDGASTDGTLDVVRSNLLLIDKYVSEPDEGIYDAMNKGLDLANGEYVIFINSGDELLVNLEDVVASLAVASPVMIYGKANVISRLGKISYIRGKPLKSVNRFLKGMPICHQAILYRRDCLGKYDLRFRVISDCVLTYKLVKRFGLKRTHFIDLPVVNYYEGGFSDQASPMSILREQEVFYRSIGARFYFIVKWINFNYRHKIKKYFCRSF